MVFLIHVLFIYVLYFGVGRVDGDNLVAHSLQLARRAEAGASFLVGQAHDGDDGRAGEVLAVDRVCADGLGADPLDQALVVVVDRLGVAVGGGCALVDPLGALEQRLVEVGKEVLDVFESNRFCTKKKK